MTRADIEELIPFIPEDSGYVRDLRSDVGMNQEKVEHYIKVLSHAINDPKFGWHFVLSWLRLDKPLPVEAIKHTALVRAFDCMKNGRTSDRAIIHAVALEMPDSYCARSVMRCALVSGSKKLSDTDKWLNLPPGCTRAYNDLFFNVVERRKDPGYMASIIWPEGRLTEMNDNYLQDEDRSQLMLRASVVHGIDSAMQLAGISHQGVLDGVSGTTRLESSIMTNAVRIGDWGGLNQGRHLTGLTHGKAVLIAVRGAGETSLSDDELALHNINAISPALDEIREHNGIKGKPVPDYKLKIERAQAAAAFAVTNQKAGQEKSRRQLKA